MGDLDVSTPGVAVVIEDDDDIREVVHAILEASGIEVHAAGNGIDGVAAVQRHNPDVITLDLGLPDIDGIEVTRRVREFSDAYIIMLTARAREVDTLQGLAVGADDFITKPFRPRELLARVESLLRRPRGSKLLGSNSSGMRAAELPPAEGSPEPGLPAALPQASKPQESETPALEYNGLHLEVATRTTRIGPNEVQLTRTEFDLLQALMETGRVVRSTTGLARWLHAREYETGGYVSESEERAIQVHIGNLRRKLGDSAQKPRWVETVRGVGYRLAAKTTENRADT
ncbi:response regulator transcription factor [Arthrobacter sp. CJ23]|uniref:response regulator transcription factor n=1 Tax=Arthrobacter sp. CJ23 TaxID=2972479 RepID=UPI00215C8D55|nr:response regulator transcription factor [Arthrobacter sp. CJ23]UVJ38150.1 response regulator transcription factor [Arthrobacter sp. CJ23]